MDQATDVMEGNVMSSRSGEPSRPMLEEIQRYLRGAPFENWADRARRFAASEALEPKDHKAYLWTLLYPGGFATAG